MLKDANCPVYINRQLTTRTRAPRDLISTTVMIHIYYQHASWEGLGKEKKRSCCCHLYLVGWIKERWVKRCFWLPLGREGRRSSGKIRRERLLASPDSSNTLTCIWAQGLPNCTRPKRPMGPSKSVLLLEVKHLVLFKGPKHSALPRRLHQPISTQCEWARQDKHMLCNVFIHIG